MNDALRAAIELRGGVVGAAPDGSVSSFRDPASELDALLDRCAWSPEFPGAIVARGPDFLDLLNRLSTQQVHDLAPGQGRATVLTSPKGRIIERLWCQHLGDEGVLVLGGPGSAASLLEHFRKFTFSERTDLMDASDRFVALCVRGPLAEQAFEALDTRIPDGSGNTIGTTGDGRALRILGHDLLSYKGFTVLLDPADAPELLDGIDRAVRSVGGRAAGTTAVDAWRIAHGLPAPGSELNGDHNPLEAGLRDAVHFSKGCYVGQEVVARLNTYDKVSRRLMVVLPIGHGETPSHGATIRADAKDVGTLGSVAAVPDRDRWIGLAYVKRSMASDGSRVRIGDPGASSGAILRDPPVDPRR